MRVLSAIRSSASLSALAWLILSLGSPLVSTAEQIDDPGRADTDVDFRWGVSIPMADGVALNGTMYRPKGSGDDPLPTILTITPYISDRYHPDAQYFARNGFGFLIVDTRGRGNSEGEFKALDLEDGRDGHDVVEWIAKQPWSNGKVLMRGGSYGGYNQWATARYFPDGLTTIVPIASPYHGIDFPMNHNVPYPYVIQWLTLTAGVTPQANTFGDGAFWQRKYLEYHESGRPFADLDEIVGMPNETFANWVSHPMADEYWAARVPSGEEFARIDLPMLTITGYYDGDQPGAMEYYRRHMQRGSAKGKANHYLVLGPWNHSGTRLPTQEFGGMKFGDKMMFDAFALDRDWYRWTLGEGPRPEFIADRVNWFVAGANTWKSAPSLAEVADTTQVFHLASPETNADSAFTSGSLTRSEAGSSDVDQYVYDPIDLSKARAGAPDNYITDQTEVMMTDGDGLIYHSKPLDQPLEIAGYIKLEAWIETNVPDTDVNATLYEVLADGSSIALTGQTLRLRHRDGLDTERLMEPGVPERVVFDRFTFFSRLIAPGSRLRLFLRPANGLAQQRHYNGPGPVSMQSKEDARTAVVSLHMGPQTRSTLTLPVVSASATEPGQ